MIFDQDIHRLWECLALRLSQIFQCGSIDMLGVPEHRVVPRIDDERAMLITAIIMSFSFEAEACTILQEIHHGYVLLQKFDLFIREPLSAVVFVFSIEAFVQFLRHDSDLFIDILSVRRSMMLRQLDLTICIKVQDVIFLIVYILLYEILTDQ